MPPQCMIRACAFLAGSRVRNLESLFLPRAAHHSTISTPFPRYRRLLLSACFLVHSLGPLRRNTQDNVEEDNLEPIDTQQSRMRALLKHTERTPSLESITPSPRMTSTNFARSFNFHLFQNFCCDCQRPRLDPPCDCSQAV